MWFEILPSFAIVISGLVLPNVAIYTINKLFLGNAYTRVLNSDYEKHYFLRDVRVSGVNNAYKQIGLDCLSGTEEEEKKCDCTV